MIKTCLLFIALFINSACASQWPSIQSRIAKDPVIEEKVLTLLNSMSLEEKVAQMIQAEIKFIKPEELKDFPLGSVLNGGGSFPNNNKKAKAQDWVQLAEKYYQASISSGIAIPLIWGTDAVHGHNNVYGATIFPHNIGLGAAGNTTLIKQIAKATTIEVMATGLDWIFAPTLAVVRDDRWGRTYEGYSEDPEIVSAFAGKIIEGIQGNDLSNDNLIATAKHFIGDGGTVDGVDQGNNVSSEEELIKTHAQGYFTALEAGAQTVMASFNSWQGKKIHGLEYLLTDVLKKKMSFDGFVIGDWNGHGQVDGCSNSSCAQAINAGVDMLMAPEDWKQIYYNTIGQVKSGEIPLERINDAVSRILRVKIRYGLFEKDSPLKRKYANDPKVIGNQNHRSIAKQAVRESLVLLKNKESILPLAAGQEILVTGSGADNIPKQCGGWSLTWQGTGNTNADFPGATSILDGIKSKLKKHGGKLSTDANSSKAKIAIVVFGEEPYAEGQGDLRNLHYNEKYSEDLKLLQSLKAQGLKTISVFITGRPMWMNPEINASDAFIVAWLPGSEGGAVADLLFSPLAGEPMYDFKGKLSFSWPNTAAQTAINRGPTNKALFPYGYGLNLSQVDTLGDDLQTNPYPAGEIILPKRSLEVFKARPVTPFKAFAQSELGPMIELPNGVGETVKKVIKVNAIDFKLQEDGRLIKFSGEARGNYFFKTSTPINLDEIKLEKGNLHFNLKVSLNSPASFYILIGGLKIDYTDQLDTSDLNQWKQYQITRDELVKLGVDLNHLSQGFGIETEGAWEVGIAEVAFN
jgi:beta-glucosidase